MDTFEVQHLKEPTEAQIEEVSDMCSRAFYEEITHKAILGGDWSLHPDFCRAVTRATVLEGELYIVKSGNEIVATASWFGPDTYLFKTKEQRALGYDEVFDKISHEAKYWNMHTSLEVLVKLKSELFSDEEKKKRWWLNNLVTKLGHEGKGYATALIDTFYDKIKGDGMLIGVAPAEEINVKKYMAMGFKKRGGSILPAQTGDFYVQIMSREADREQKRS
ncbi:hypothetical protein BDQ12DRAFT_717025 [Crucibulum laeve]|uniref:N-acetyltransferase domain-containing protein n=1 Tax=Crucibulum laeve TaxID=68775 RepID=A0A5C3LE96_9AGAR|nr:hypothetical protein BDQ12DRAFT_717025 [Crucibulum laeve]